MREAGDMRVVIQRVSGARVLVDGKVTGRIGKGLMILAGIANGDTKTDIRWMAEKCMHLRIFENDAGKFHYSLMDVQGEILAVSQFTLFADCRRGRRPGFTDAAPPEIAAPLFDSFVDILRDSGITVATGIFGAAMEVEIHNSGPVTILIDSKEKA